MIAVDGEHVCGNCGSGAFDAIEEDGYRGEWLLECVYCGVGIWRRLKVKSCRGKFVIKHGRYAGKSLMQVDAEPNGRQALVWLSKNSLSEKLRAIISEYLAAAPQA